MKANLRIDGGTLVLPGEGLIRAGLAVSGGKITAVAMEDALPPPRRSIDASGLYVLPGLVDPHGHMGMNDDFPGECRAETRAAVQGGVTTIGLFIKSAGNHLKDAPALSDIIHRAAYSNVFFNLSITTPKEVEEIPRYARELGVRSFKFYMWGVPGVPTANDALLFDGFRQIAKLGRRGLACVHAETKTIVDAETKRIENLKSWKGSDLKRYTASHPALAEALAIETAAHLAGCAGVRLYIVHLSSKEGLETATRLKEHMPDLILEATPHHLNLTEDDPNGTFAKIAPPVRHKSHPQALWRGVADGRIETIGTDNLPRNRVQKVDHWRNAITGFPGYGTSLALMLDRGFHKRGIPLERIAAMVSLNPAKAFGWFPKKGTLRKGADADIVLVDLNKSRTVRWKELGHWSDFSAYEGWRLKGWPVMTIQGGQVAFENGEIVAKEGSGGYLRH